MNQDEHILHSLGIEPCIIPEPVKTHPCDRSAERDKAWHRDSTAPVPAYVYDALVDAFVRLDAECAVAHGEVKKLRMRTQHALAACDTAEQNARRWRGLFLRASVVAGVMALVALAGWVTRL